MPPSTSVPNQPGSDATIVETIGGKDAQLIIRLIDQISTSYPDLTHTFVFFALLIALLKMGFEWALEMCGSWLAKKELANTQNWEDNEKLYDLMDDLLNQTSASRGFIIKSHNSGGIPRPGVKTYCSIVHSVGDGIARTCQLWDSMLMDATYSRLISRLLKENIFILKAEDLPDSDLKTTYNDSGVIYSVVALLGSNKRELFYCSYNFNEPYDKLTANSRLAKIRLQAKAIAKLIDPSDYENSLINSLIKVVRQ